MAAGSSASEARLARIPQKAKEKSNPPQPRSSSTLRPKRSSRKTFPLRCDRDAWQKHAVSGCHHAHAMWCRCMARMGGRRRTPSRRKTTRLAMISGGLAARRRSGSALLKSEWAAAASDARRSWRVKGSPVKGTERAARSVRPSDSRRRVKGCDDDNEEEEDHSSADGRHRRRDLVGNLRSCCKSTCNDLQSLACGNACTAYDALH